MIVEILPAGMAMTGNPIRVEVSAPGEKFVRISVKYASKEIFSGSGIPDNTGRVVFLINDVLAELLSSCTISSAELLVPITSMSANYTVVVTGQSGTKETLQGECFTGGASKNELRKFVDVNILETFKILNRNGNFFLTTRTQLDLISMRESEIYPLYFIHPGGVIRVEDSSENSVVLPMGEARKVYALNLPMIRKQFLEAGTLSNYFKIFVDDICACCVVLIPAVDADDRYLVQFRNSYGAYERIEVTGTPTLESKYDNTNAQYAGYDENIHDFSSSTKKVKATKVIKVHTGYKTPEEINFINDLLSSDDVQLLTMNADVFKVLVSAQKVEQKLLQSVTPESIQLNIQFVDTEAYNTPGIIGNALANRIFSVHFDQTFN
jgi:hypothetical protein